MVRLDTVMQCALKKLSQDKVFQAPTVRVNPYALLLRTTFKKKEKV